MGQEVFGSIRIVNSLAEGKLKIIPDNLVVSSGNSGGNGGNDMMNSLFGISIIEKLTGRKFSDIEKEQLLQKKEWDVKVDGKEVIETANEVKSDSIQTQQNKPVIPPKIKNIIEEKK
jgi:hypothetical protein